MTWVYDGARRTCVPVARRLFRFSISGAQHIPAAGAAILAPNHQSATDHFLVAAATERPVVNLAHREVFDVPVLGRFLRAIDAVPVWRRGGDPEAMAAAEQRLRHGALVCVFPEGDWTPDGRIHRFHTGAARLAQATGAPIVPMGITGSRETRFGKPFRAGGPVTLAVGAPQPVAPGDDVRAATQRLQHAVAALCGLEVTDAYAHQPAGPAAVGVEARA